jgi:hypothetical protein
MALDIDPSRALRRPSELVALVEAILAASPKEYGKYRAGAIFVRHPGRTDQAEPGDIRMLEDRLLVADQPLALRVRPAGADDSVVVHPVGNLGAAFKAWEARARHELAPPPLPSPAPDFARADLSGLLSEFTQNVNRMNSVLDGFSERDQRTDTEFEEQVAKYIRKSRDYYVRLALARLGEMGGSLLRLNLGNASDRYYADVRVKIAVPPLARVQEPEAVSSVPAAPKRPSARGARTAMLPFSLVPENYYMPAIRTPVLDYSPFFDIARDSDGSVVTYDFRGIRAEDCISLEPFPLLIISQETTADFDISWSVTTSSVGGVARGSCTVQIGEPVDAADLLPELLAEDDG